MQYITRAEASQKFDISLVTLDKYLKLWRIYIHQVIIDHSHLFQDPINK